MTRFFFAPASLHRLRRRLLPAGPGVAAGILQDAGFATGEALVVEWEARLLARTGLSDPAQLDATWFGPLFGELCLNLGWGNVSMTALGDRGAIFSSRDWTEADPGNSDKPGCYFSCGCLAAFLTAQAGAPIAVLEVECRSCGDEECRFVAGSAEMLAAVYDLVSAGGNWRDAFAEATAGA